MALPKLLVSTSALLDETVLLLCMEESPMLRQFWRKDVAERLRLQSKFKIVLIILLFSRTVTWLHHITVFAQVKLLQLQLLFIKGTGRKSLSVSSLCRDKVYLWVTETLRVWDVLVAFTASFAEQTTRLLDYLYRRGSHSL